MIHYGVSFFMLEKLGAVVGVSNLHLCGDARTDARGVQQTRNAPGALYSVAGTDAGEQSWEPTVVSSSRSST